MMFEIRPVPLDSVTFSSSWNLHPCELYTLPRELVSSFARVGILHPPILLTKEAGRFEIVCGFKRLLFAASILERREVDCLILAANTEPEAILDIILTDQFLARSLSIVEKARFLEICTRFLQPQQIADSYCDRLMLDRRQSTLQKLLDILSEPHESLTAFHSGTLQEKVVMELLDLPSEDDRNSLVKFFKRLQMGEGKQRRLLSLIRDLAFYDDRPIAAFLEDSSIQEILNDRNMNNPQKVQHLNSFLQQKLNPLFSNAERDFADKVKSLKIPENCTISHSPSFEKDEVTLSITFENLAACQEWLPTLKHGLA